MNECMPHQAKSFSELDPDQQSVARQIFKDAHARDDFLYSIGIDGELVSRVPCVRHEVVAIAGGASLSRSIQLFIAQIELANSSRRSPLLSMSKGDLQDLVAVVGTLLDHAQDELKTR